MKLYLKLGLIVVAAVLTQCFMSSISRAGLEVGFTLRCWSAHQMQDPELEDQLVEEAQERLINQMRRDSAAKRVALPAVVASSSLD